MKPETVADSISGLSNTRFSNENRANVTNENLGCSLQKCEWDLSLQSNHPIKVSSSHPTGTKTAGGCVMVRKAADAASQHLID